MADSDSSTGGTAAPLEELTVERLMRAPTTTVDTDAHLAAAAFLMKRFDDTALVVTTEDAAARPIAVITDADVSQAVADGRDLDEVRINDLRLRRPVAVPPDTSVTAAAEQMLAMAVQHLPVVVEERLVGLVDLAAVCRALLEQARDSRPAS